MIAMNGNYTRQLRFYQEELFDAKNKLFRAKNLKQVRFLQNRIGFLQEKISEIEDNGKVIYAHES